MYVVYSNSKVTLCFYYQAYVTELIGNGYFMSKEGIASRLLFVVCNVIGVCACNAECVCAFV